MKELIEKSNAIFVCLFIFPYFLEFIIIEIIIEIISNSVPVDMFGNTGDSENYNVNMSGESSDKSIQAREIYRSLFEEDALLETFFQRISCF